MGNNNQKGLPLSGIVINRPGVAGAVLESPLSLTDSVGQDLSKYLQDTVNPKP